VTEGRAIILLVEDDEPTRRSVAGNLAGHGWTVHEAGDGHDALRQWEAARPDLIVLDLGLPDMEGLTVVRRVRRDATTPILILSARDQERDKVQALEAGAADYVTKPFGMAELRARIVAILRRAGGPAADQSGTLVLGPVSLDVMTRSVVVAGTPVDLTPREYELLKVMLSQPRSAPDSRPAPAGRVGHRLCRGIALPARPREPAAPQARGGRSFGPGQ